jgi:hypothetical protein|tara:strand:- start:139 stop:387 length:249 start_codon:yes stop_codon:yes gene_type:complete
MISEAFYLILMFAMMYGMLYWAVRIIFGKKDANKMNKFFSRHAINFIRWVLRSILKAFVDIIVYVSPHVWRWTQSFWRWAIS